MAERGIVKLKEFVPINRRREDERPREKLLKKGSESLSNSELMAILIGNGTKNKSAIDVASELLDSFGSISELTRCELEEFIQLDGIGKAKAATLSAAFELGKRIKIESIDIKDKITSPEKIANYFIHKLGSETVEKFYAVYLNTANKIIKEKEVFSGTLNASIVHPREVFRSAVSVSANSIIIVHNHPSGNPEPSNEDINITKQLSSAAEIMEIKLLDHLIIAGDKYYSFRAHGQL